MNIDVSNVPDTLYLDTEGEHTLKVVSIGEGVTANNNPVLKVSFADKDGAVFNDDFVLTEKAMFRVKNLIKALRLPDKIEAKEMVGRYTLVELYRKTERTQNGSFEKMVARSYKESPLQAKIDSEAGGAF